MKKIILFFVVFSISFFSAGQSIVSGGADGLILAYDSTTKMVVTGYYENATGEDEQTKQPRFTCIFYLEGKVTGQRVDILSYYPLAKADDMIRGTLEIIDSKTVTIKLETDHGGCPNVQQFESSPVTFKLEGKATWNQIRYVDVEKTYFYKDTKGSNKTRAYLIKGNVVYVDAIENGWALCTYQGKVGTKGWIKVGDLNK